MELTQKYGIPLAWKHGTRHRNCYDFLYFYIQALNTPHMHSIYSLYPHGFTAGTMCIIYLLHPCGLHAEPHVLHIYHAWLPYGYHAYFMLPIHIYTAL